jgi:hypothetical protein
MFVLDDAILFIGAGTFGVVAGAVGLNSAIDSVEQAMLDTEAKTKEDCVKEAEAALRKQAKSICAKYERAMDVLEEKTRQETAEVILKHFQAKGIL